MKIDEDGITTIETLIAVIIVSISCALAFSSVTAVLRSGKRTESAVHTIASVSLSDREMRRLALGVKIPLWERRCLAQVTDDSIIIPWYKGIRENTIKFTTINQALEITVKNNEKEDKVLLLRNMQDINISIIESKAGMPKGLDVSWVSGQHQFHSTLPFGSAYREETE